MTSVTFETATIAEAVKAAAKVAPNKGIAFDKASGIVLEVKPSENVVVIRATDTDIFYMAWLDTVEMDGEDDVWRLPSKVFAGVMTSLPIGSGKTVKLTRDGSRIHMEVKPGRTKAQFGLMRTEDYPMWMAFSPDGLTKAEDLGGRIANIEWAASKEAAENPLNGVHLTGEEAIATDKYRLAVARLVIEGLTEPITVPAGLLGTVLKQTGEVQIGVEEVGSSKSLLIMPDAHTQIRTVVFGAKYINAKRIMNRDWPEFVGFEKSVLLELISRASNFEEGRSAPTLQVIIGSEEIAIFMKGEERGLLGDVLEVPGHATHARTRFNFTPRNLTDALNNSPNEKVILGYDPNKTTGLVYVTDSAGYECWVMPKIASDV